MRFRKSIRIMKGVRINLSNKGVSTTIGIPGLSVNIGKKGTYLNTGIPGTGLYDRKKICDSHKSGSNLVKTRVPEICAFDLNMQTDGEIIIVNSDGSPITNEHMLHRIKQTNEYKELKH